MTLIIAPTDFRPTWIYYVDQTSWKDQSFWWTFYTSIGSPAWAANKRIGRCLPNLLAVLEMLLYNFPHCFKEPRACKVQCFKLYLSHLQYITEACCVQLSFYGTDMTTSHNHNIRGVWKATEKRHFGLRQHGTWQHLSAPKQWICLQSPTWKSAIITIMDWINRTQISPPIDILLSLLVLVLFSEEVLTDFCIPFGFLTPCEF